MAKLNGDHPVASRASASRTQASRGLAELGGQSSLSRHESDRHSPRRFRYRCRVALDAICGGEKTVLSKHSPGLNLRAFFTVSEIRKPNGIRNLLWSDPGNTGKNAFGGPSGRKAPKDAHDIFYLATNYLGGSAVERSASREKLCAQPSEGGIA